MTTVGNATPHHERIMSLDALRGVCAISVMCYHVVLFSKLGAARAVGDYGVYAFFAISGAALAWVYRDQAAHGFPFRSYAVARLARIVPLLWVAMAVKMIGELPPGTTHRQIAENVALVSPITHAPPLLVGQWSVSIELVFYVMFPLLLLVLRRWWLLGAFTAIALVGRLAIIEHIWPKGYSLAGFDDYQRIWSFLFFFGAGMLIAELRRSRPAATRPWPLVAALVVMAAVFSASPLPEKAVLGGITGATLAVGCVVSVALAAWAPNPTGRVGLLVVETLGAISYATYLLHPLVYSAVTRLSLPTAGTVVATITITLLAAWCSERWFETPVRRWIRSRVSPVARAATQ